MNKQNQEVGDKSTAIQVAGNVYVGHNYEEIKKIFLDLFELNFPRVQQQAKEIATQRVNDFLEELRKSFNKNKEAIDQSKFIDPGIQYEMQQMAVDVARRGNKSNMELLSELLCTITSSNCPELIELIASETRKIIPMLSKKHLSYLSFEILFLEGEFAGKTLEEINTSLKDIINHLDGLENIGGGDISYLFSNGCIKARGIRVTGIVPSIVKSIKEYEKIDLPKLKIVLQEKGLSNIETFITLSEKLGIGTYYPSAYGRLIGWLNLGKYSGVDPKQLFE